jgi:hypothetical protein
MMLIAAAAACGPGRRVSAPEAAPAPPPSIGRPTARMIPMCAVQNGQLVEVTAQFDPATGDTSFGRPEWGPESRRILAAVEPWFIRDEPITVEGRRYVKFGTERVFRAGELAYAGLYLDLPLFTRADAPRPPEALFIPTRFDCRFQGYRLSDDVSSVRGG